MDNSKVNIGVILPGYPLYFWRQAIFGIRQAQSALEEQLGIRISLDITVYPKGMQGFDAKAFFSAHTDKKTNGWIVYPINTQECELFIKEQSHRCPVVLLNDLCTYACTELPEDRSQPFGDSKNTVYIGTNAYSEGSLAFELIQPMIDVTDHVVAIKTVTSHYQNSLISDIRIEHFKQALMNAKPTATLTRIDFSLNSKTSSAFLAQKLIDVSEASSVDCVYVSTGITYRACEAVGKLRSRFPDVYKNTFCIGHELAPSDIKNLSSRLQRGFVIQNIVEMGYEAVRMLTAHRIMGKPMENRLFEPSVFTNERYSSKEN